MIIYISLQLTVCGVTDMVRIQAEYAGKPLKFYNTYCNVIA